MKFYFLLFVYLFGLVYSVDNYFGTLQQELYQEATGKDRVYYIAIDEVIWNYDSNKSTRYYKAVYNEYTDNSYKQKKQKFLWQGHMGPILRAEVGDTIHVHLWNRANYPFTLHPHGVFYEFEMEGAVFKDGFEHAAVAPNKTYSYVWKALPRAGPGPNDGNSIVWGYHSHVSENDIYAGLYGAILIYRPGTLSDKEIVTSFYVADENQSPYLTRTLSELTSQKMKPKDHRIPCINGLATASPKDLVIKADTIWHLIGWGTFVDDHNIRWENGEVERYNELIGSIRLFPASFYTITYRPTQAGIDVVGDLDRDSTMRMRFYVVLDQ
ncbi:Cupredoxin [Backusella circina FSU 941]|nr:Cupredoxin [Backusella circina FSU 941]